MKRLAILGASGHGKVVADTAVFSEAWSEIDFFDDAWPTLQVNGVWPVIGDSRILLDSLIRYDGVIVAIGNNSVRLNKIHLLQANNAPLCNIIHPNAVVSQYVEINSGTVIFAGAVINIDVKIGWGCIINTGATIDHDCVLGNGVHVSPGAHLGGGVSVGEIAWIGIGACVRQLIEIGRNTIVGAGAVVVKNVPDDLTVVGVPATVLRRSKV